MPKYITHIAILDKAIERLEASSDPNDREIARILRENREAAILGAIGPDLFFWGMDYETSQILYDVLQVYKFFKNLYDNTIGRISEAISALGEPVEEALEVAVPGAVELVRTVLREVEETKAVLEEISRGTFFIPIINRVNNFASLQVLSIDEFVLEQIRSFGGAFNLVKVGRLGHYLYDLMNTPLQFGDLEDKWYWFDMLHYRYTTLFAYNLLRNASDERSLAYAYGYMTHIAGDVVGHAYVNVIVKGPYRLHPQRHAVVENFIDAWVFREYYGGDITVNISDVLRLPTQLPDSILTQLYQSFIDTYNDVPHPKLINQDNNGFYTLEDIRRTYEVFIEIINFLTGVKPTKPEPPFEDVWGAIERAIDRFRAPPSPPSGGICFSWECIEETLEYIGELLEWTVETIFSVIDTVLTVLASVPVSAMLAILYAIQYGLYEILTVIRDILVYGGYQYPNNEELDTDEAQRLIFPQMDLEGYPYLHDHDETPLEDPAPRFELDMRFPSPYGSGDTPRTFIEELPSDPWAIRMYATANTPQETINLLNPLGSPSQGVQQGIHMGNAADLSIWLIRGLRDNDPNAINANWNLDADRAYGYRHWRTDSLPADMDTVVYEEYIV